MGSKTSHYFHILYSSTPFLSFISLNEFKHDIQDHVRTFLLISIVACYSGDIENSIIWNLIKYSWSGINYYINTFFKILSYLLPLSKNMDNYLNFVLMDFYGRSWPVTLGNILTIIWGQRPYSKAVVQDGIDTRSVP